MWGRVSKPQVLLPTVSRTTLLQRTAKILEPGHVKGLIMGGILEPLNQSHPFSKRRVKWKAWQLFVLPPPTLKKWMMPLLRRGTPTATWRGRWVRWLVQSSTNFDWKGSSVTWSSRSMGASSMPTRTSSVAAAPILGQCFEQARVGFSGKIPRNMSWFKGSFYSVIDAWVPAVFKDVVGCWFTLSVPDCSCVEVITTN